MCKFNLKIFVLIVCCAQLIQIGVTSPLGGLLFDDYADDEPANSDYDLHYDERQNGTENYRFNINGVVIAVPGGSSSIGLLASNYLLELADAAAAANEESASDHGDDDDDSSDNKPYDFEIPTGSHEDSIENSEPVVISADSLIVPETKPIAKPTENLSVIQDLKPENHVDAINEKESATNKKDLTEIVNEDVTLNANIKPKNEVIIKESVPDTTRQVSQPETTRYASPKAGSKRRNKFKLRLGTLINYLKRSRE